MSQKDRQGKERYKGNSAIVAMRTLAYIQLGVV